MRDEKTRISFSFLDTLLVCV